MKVWRKAPDQEPYCSLCQEPVEATVELAQDVDACLKCLEKAVEAVQGSKPVPSARAKYVAAIAQWLIARGKSDDPKRVHELECKDEIFVTASSMIRDDMRLASLQGSKPNSEG